MEDIATLYVLYGDRSIPSYDPKCSMILTLIDYLKLENVLIQYDKIKPNISVPRLLYRKGIIHDLYEIQQTLETMCNSSESVPRPLTNSFDDYQSSKIYAYKRFLEFDMTCIVLSHFFAKPVNKQHAMKLYKTQFYFPSSMIFIKLLENRIEDCFDILEKKYHNHELCDKENQHFAEVLETLESGWITSKDRNNSKGSYTSLDAVIVGYLIPILRTNFPDPYFRNTLMNFPTVVDYINKYFDDNPVNKNLGLNFKAQEEINKTENNKEDESAPKSLIITAILVTGTAMISYGIYLGVIRY